MYSGDSSKGDVTPAAEQADLLNEEGPEDVDRQEDASTSLSKCFLIIHSVSKRQNIGNLLRSATAFGVTEVTHLYCHECLLSNVVLPEMENLLLRKIGRCGV